MWLSWLNPTGGLRYHLRAWRFADTLWSPYLRNVRVWLNEWTPPERALLLIGPSGGYSLSRAFVHRFESVAILEPDPIGRWILRRRVLRKRDAEHSSLANVRWVRSDPFRARRDGFAIARFEQLLQEHSGHAVLFCNFLGQMGLLDPSGRHADSLREWRERLGTTLAGRSFASYHDRFSGLARPALHSGAAYENVVANDRLADDLYRSALARRDVVDTCDHGTGSLFAGHARQFFSWEITPRFFHLIEAVRYEARMSVDVHSGERSLESRI